MYNAMPDTLYRSFLDKLKALHEVGIALSRLGTLDELYRQSVVLGREELGFDRLGLLLLDEKVGEIRCTFGTDTEGNVRDERHLSRRIEDDPRVMEMIASGQPMMYWQDTDLVDEWLAVGTGWNAAAILWDGDRYLGWLATDNLLRKESLNTNQLELLTLYATRIGHLVSRKRAEDANQKAHERLAMLIERSPVGMAEYDADFVITAWNPECERIFGYSAEEAIGHSAMDLFIPEDQQPLVQERLQKLAEALGSGENISGINENVTKDGRRLVIHWHNYALVDETGAFVGYASLAQDVTDQLKAEQHRIELELERQKVAFLRMFIGNITHDIKTPLTGIRNGLYLLRRYTDPVQRDEKITQLYEYTERLDSLIQKMLTMSHLDHQPNLRHQMVNLNELIMSVARDLKVVIERKKLRFNLDLDVRLPMVSVDPDTIKSAMLNLMENAVTYTPEARSVSVTTQHDKDEIIVTFKDNGIGIAEQDLYHIFERFYRSDGARTMASSGSGLGLSIVQRAVELHDGRVEVTSTPGTGTTFTVYLPAAPVAPSARSAYS